MKINYSLPAIGLAGLITVSCGPTKTQQIWGNQRGIMGPNSQGSIASPPRANEVLPNTNAPNGGAGVFIPDAPGAASGRGNAAKPAKPNGGGGAKHKVTTGDTLWGLGVQYGVTVEQIQKANNLNGAFIRTGQELIIP